MNQLWECSSGGDNNFATLACVDNDDLWNGIFDTDGSPKHWAKVPAVMPGVDKKRKQPLPLPDIRWLVPGSMVLNQRAYDALHGFLQQFGELLELDCQGEKNYFYNVTNLISCIDFENSEKRGTAVVKAEFLLAAIPPGEQIFKDRLTARARIYLTQVAKDNFNAILGAHCLTGLQFYPAGKKF